MNTLAVMCIELQSTRPSMTPLFLTASATCGVMFTKAIFEAMLNVRYSVWDFIFPPMAPLAASHTVIVFLVLCHSQEFGLGSLCSALQFAPFAAGANSPVAKLHTNHQCHSAPAKTATWNTSWACTTPSNGAGQPITSSAPPME